MTKRIEQAMISKTEVRVYDMKRYVSPYYCLHFKMIFYNIFARLFQHILDQLYLYAYNVTRKIRKTRKFTLLQRHLFHFTYSLKACAQSSILSRSSIPWSKHVEKSTCVPMRINTFFVIFIKMLQKLSDIQSNILAILHTR